MLQCTIITWLAQHWRNVYIRCFLEMNDLSEVYLGPRTNLLRLGGGGGDPDYDTDPRFGLQSFLIFRLLLDGFN